MSHIMIYLKDEKGASAAEYALILAVVCGAVATALTGLNSAITGGIGAAAGHI